MSRVLWSLYVLLLFDAVRPGPRCIPTEPCGCRRLKDRETHKVRYIMDCSRRQLTSIPLFHSRNKVDTVLLGHNKIMHIPAHAFRDLSMRVLDLQDNSISSIHNNSFYGAEKTLKVINLRKNKIRDVPYGALHKTRSLQCLYLDDNDQDTVLRKLSFPKLRSLDTLTLRNFGLRLLEHDSFKGLKMLRFLDISRNKIHRIDGTLRNLGKLEFLNISSNPLSKIPSGSLKKMKHLTELHIRNTDIASLPFRAFSPLERLKVFDFSNNVYLRHTKDLNALSRVNKTLHVLNISNCSLLRWPEVLASLFQLETLDISSNKITEITGEAMANMTSLKNLVMANNPLRFTDGMFTGLENSLQYVDLSRMGISTLSNAHLSNLTRLEKIVVSFNNISEISDYFFSGLHAHEYDASYNRISRVAPLAFYNISTPKALSINLRGNRLRSLDFAEASLCRFAHIDVTDNPIECDCSTYNLTMNQALQLRGECQQFDIFTEFHGIDLITNTLKKTGSKLCAVTSERACEIVNTGYKSAATNSTGSAMASTVPHSFYKIAIIYVITWLW